MQLATAKITIAVKQIKQLVRLSSPTLIAKINLVIRGVAVTWIFAELGEQALAAGALGYSLLIATVTFLLGVITSSVGVLISYAIGAKDNAEITTVLQQGLWLGVLLSIPCILLFYNVTPILFLFGQEKEIAILAGQFAQSLAWIFIPYTVITNLTKLFANLKKTHITMLYSFFGLGVTIAVSYLLALGKLGLPNMGIAGIGWGITIAYWLQAMILIFHVSFGENTKHYYLFFPFFMPNRDCLKSMWAIGWPLGFKYNIKYSLFFVLAVIIGALDEKDLAVYQVMLQFFVLSSCFAGSVGLGTGVLTGQAIGGKQTLLVTSSCYVGLLLILSYMGIVASIIIIFDTKIVSLFFNEGTPDFQLLTNILIWIILFQLLDSFDKVIASILIAFKDPHFSLIVETLGLWLISLPLGYFLGIYKGIGLSGFLIALIVGIFLSSIAMVIRFQFKLKAVVAQFDC